jgi:hypothetical protein
MAIEIRSLDATVNYRGQSVDPERKLKYRKILAYLEASLDLEEMHQGLDYLFQSTDQGEGQVALVIRQPKERNICSRLRDHSTLPDLTDSNGANDYETQLNHDELSERRRRYAEGSEDSDDKVADKICQNP